MISELRLVVGVAKAQRLHFPATNLSLPFKSNHVRFWTAEWLDPIIERVLLKRASASVCRLGRLGLKAW